MPPYEIFISPLPTPNVIPKDPLGFHSGVFKGCNVRGDMSFISLMLIVVA